MVPSIEEENPTMASASVTRPCAESGEAAPLPPPARSLRPRHLQQSGPRRREAASRYTAE